MFRSFDFYNAASFVFLAVLSDCMLKAISFTLILKI